MNVACCVSTFAGIILEDHYGRLGASPESSSEEVTKWKVSLSGTICCCSEHLGYRLSVVSKNINDSNLFVQV